MLVRQDTYARIVSTGLGVALAVAAAACSRNSGEPEDRPGSGDEQASENATPEPEPEPQVPEGPTGSIEGRITLEGEPPERVPLRRGSDPFCGRTEMLTETVITGDGGGLQNVFVRVSGPDVEGPAPQEPVVVDQNECMYRPRVQGAVEGQTLVLKNSDDTLHNIHAREMTLERSSGNTLYNLAQPAGSGEVQQPIPDTDVVELRCDLHSWMRAFVIVSDHPYFATTGEDGTFRIDGVPTGSHKLELWHELYGSQTVDAPVAEGETTEVELSFDAEADRPD